MKIASASKGNLFAEFSDLITKIERLNQYVKKDVKLLGIKRVLCRDNYTNEQIENY